MDTACAVQLSVTVTGISTEWACGDTAALLFAGNLIFLNLQTGVLRGPFFYLFSNSDLTPLQLGTATLSSDETTTFPGILRKGAWMTFFFELYGAISK